MAAASAVVQHYSHGSLGSLFSEMFMVECVMDPAELVDAAGETNTVAAVGVELGDIILGLSSSVDMQDIGITAYVQAADAIELRYQNEGGNTVNLGSNTIRMWVGRPLW